MKICEHCGTIISCEKKRNRFCNRSCSNAWQHAMGLRRDYLNDKTTWEWWIEKHGIEVALQKKEHHRIATSIATTGEKNPMYGRHDHAEGIRKFHSGNKGKTLDEIYGKEKADSIRNKLSISRIGEKNPAYGKVYDRGGRSKIQGVYRGIRFRSSYELAFLVEQFRIINCFDDTKITIPKSIEYVLDGKNRTYFCDFQIGNTVIEIKPSALVTYKSNVVKFAAMREYCIKNNLTFQVITECDLSLLTHNEMLCLEDVIWNKGAIEYLNDSQNNSPRRRRSNG